jgi:predicted dinucleotide-binding enzyme
MPAERMTAPGDLERVDVLVVGAGDEAARMVMDLVRDAPGPAPPGGKPVNSGGFATKE